VRAARTVSQYEISSEPTALDEDAEAIGTMEVSE